MNTRRETAAAATHTDGNMTLDLVVDRVEREGNVTSVSLKDKYYPSTCGSITALIRRLIS